MDHNHQKDIIKRSHQRSLEFGVEKDRISSKKILNQKELQQLISRSNTLLETSIPFIDSVYGILANSGFVIVLTDQNGCILYIKGEEATLKAARELNMIPGAFMDEKSIGTNAMGTAISENTAVQVTAKEHFISAYHNWTCSAAPIHNENGEIIGSLNLTANKEQVHPHTLGLVISTVKAIENYRKNIDVQHQLISSQHFAFSLMNHINFGVFAVDENDQIFWANDTACRTINIKRTLLINTPITDILPTWIFAKKQLKNKQSYIDQEEQFSLDDLSETFLFSAYDIKTDFKDQSGYLITFNSKKRFINLAKKLNSKQTKYTFEDIITQNARMLQIIHYAQVVAKNPSTILITGESGTGKEVFAQSIHANSDRKEGNFVAINCGAIPAELIESELFGYEPGAFTGAQKDGKKGKFEMANGGTIFLDEIGDMPMEMQVKLLRTIQEGYIVKVGGHQSIPIDVRIITATNKDLNKEIENDQFRLDLYYRINVIEIKIPALRERPEDIILLTRYFLRMKAEKLNKTVPQLSAATEEKIQSYEWPGNIRELENFAEKTVILHGDVQFSHWSKKENETSAQNIDQTEPENIRTLQEIEKEAIAKTIKHFNGNMSLSAKALNIGRNTLYQKCRKYGIS
jgi:transcriptional regulator of acetoin/glycerol metabolism